MPDDQIMALTDKSVIIGKYSIANITIVFFKSC